MSLKYVKMEKLKIGANSLTKLINLVLWLIIKLKDCIMRKNTKLNSAQSFPNIYIFVTMESIVHSLTQLGTSKQELSILWLKIWISICSFLRLSGAHLIRNTTRLNVIMLTIGRILEENLIFTQTISIARFVKIGKLGPSLASMKKDAIYRHPATSLMDGRSKNITL